MTSCAETSYTCCAEASYTCALCPRLAGFINEWRKREPSWYNGPVKSFGNDDAALLIVGLAPGLRGANRTGRPFTGDYAGDLLYGTLLEFGLAKGVFLARPDDGLQLVRTMITNAVRCVPPENKPAPAEIKTCRSYLAERIRQLPKLKVILSLGRISHESVVAAAGGRQRDFPFAHAARHEIELPDSRHVTLHDSYHCSRYNTNTGRLTAEMFRSVFRVVVSDLGR